MIKNKNIIVVLIILFVIQLSFAEKRAPRVSMNDLTNPHSPSYVPYPYPQTNDEVIADLKYYIKKDMESGGEPELLMKDPAYVNILPDLLKKNPKYKIHTIRKEKMLTPTCLRGYYWLIIISNADNTENMRVALEDTGLFALECISPQGKNPQKIITDQDVLLKLSKTLKYSISMNDVKSIQWVNYPPSMGYGAFPAWEISLKKGKTYYYEQKKDKFYTIKKIHLWQKVNNTGKRTDLSKYVKRGDIITCDRLNDKLITYQQVLE